MKQNGPKVLQDAITKQAPAGERGKFTLDEILSQPETWADAIEILKGQNAVIRDFLQGDDFEQVVFTGCGSTYYLSLAAASLYREMTGSTAIGLPASELWLSPEANLSKQGQTLLVAVSRSGETSETIKACDLFHKDKRGKIITLVCKSDSPLTQMGDLNLLFPSAMEQSVAQTRAFTTLYLATAGLCAISADSGDPFDQLLKLPSAGRQILDTSRDLAADFGSNLGFDRIYFLGSGGRLGLASELSLKMKEMSLTHSEAFHFMEFRHGPKAMVNTEALVVGLVSGDNASHEGEVLDDMKQLGGAVISIGENKADIQFNSKIEEVYRNVLYLPFGQMLAYRRAIAKGLDPDHPTNLDAVVKLSM